MDKQEIIDIAYKIDTYDISIEPYEDCCTVFTPKHPRTRPVLKYVKEAQEKRTSDLLLRRLFRTSKLQEFRLMMNNQTIERGIDMDVEIFSLTGKNSADLSQTSGEIDKKT